MNHLITAVFVILLSTWIRGDICDYCVCTKSDCEPANGITKSECHDQVDEQYLCDGSEVRDDQSTLNLNSIQWPNRNNTVSVHFNNFKLAYLTK